MVRSARIDVPHSRRRSGCDRCRRPAVPGRRCPSIRCSRWCKLGASERSAGKNYGDAIRDAGGKVSVVRARSRSTPSSRAMHGRGRGAHDAPTASTWCSPPSRPTRPSCSSRASPRRCRWSRRRAPSATSRTCRCSCRRSTSITRSSSTCSASGAAGRASSRRARTAPPPAWRSRSSRSTTRSASSKVVMTSMQSVSGAGRSPGVLALDIIDNVIPYIAKEEEKVEKETKKILGTLRRRRHRRRARSRVSCTCTRVNVIEGHTESVFVGLQEEGAASTRSRRRCASSARELRRARAAVGAASTSSPSRTIPIGRSRGSIATTRAA